MTTPPTGRRPVGLAVTHEASRGSPPGSVPPDPRTSARIASDPYTPAPSTLRHRCTDRTTGARAIRIAIAGTPNLLLAKGPTLPPRPARGTTAPRPRQPPYGRGESRAMAPSHVADAATSTARRPAEPRAMNRAEPRAMNEKNRAVRWRSRGISTWAMGGCPGARPMATRSENSTSAERKTLGPMKRRHAVP